MKSRVQHLSGAPFQPFRAAPAPNRARRPPGSAGHPRSRAGDRDPVVDGVHEVCPLLRYVCDLDGLAEGVVDRRLRDGRVGPGPFARRLGQGASLTVAALRRADRLPVDARDPYRGGSDGHAKPAARDQALHPQAATRSGDTSETERAPEPRGRVEADPGLRARRLRQDHAAGRVAGRSSRRREIDGVALARPKRQPGRILLALRDRCAADGGAGRRRDCALAAAAAATTADRVGPRHAAQRAQRAAARHRARARRLPRRRRGRHPGRDGVPAGAPAAADAPGDHDPRRPGVAAGAPARAWRARRDPRGRSALHARGGRSRTSTR